jgi:hypothetical protein
MAHRSVTHNKYYAAFKDSITVMTQLFQGSSPYAPHYLHLMSRESRTGKKVATDLTDFAAGDHHVVTDDRSRPTPLV